MLAMISNAGPWINKIPAFGSSLNWPQHPVCRQDDAETPFDLRSLLGGLVAAASSRILHNQKLYIYTALGRAFNDSTGTAKSSHRFNSSTSHAWLASLS
jgi:hypothetical protein